MRPVDKLANGPVHYRDLMADDTANGITQSALYRARRRLGLVSTDGFWALPECPVGSQ